MTDLQTVELLSPGTPGDYDLDALERLAIAYHKRTREPDGTGGEGEYGCPGATCPGVKRLVVFATACAEHASASSLARLRAAEGRCILEVDSPSYPPNDSERKQCGCVVCLRDLLRAAEQERDDRVPRAELERQLSIAKFAGAAKDEEIERLFQAVQHAESLLMEATGLIAAKDAEMALFHDAMREMDWKASCDRCPYCGPLVMCPAHSRLSEQAEALTAMTAERDTAHRLADRFGTDALLEGITSAKDAELGVLYRSLEHRGDSMTALAAERNALQARLRELEAILEATSQTLEGQQPSEFMASFALVRGVWDMQTIATECAADLARAREENLALRQREARA